MKKLIFALVVVAFAMSSCSVVTKTSTQQEVSSPVIAVVISDLEVSNQKITYTFKPAKNIRKAGYQNCINAAVSEALAANGGGDILIETQQTVIQKCGLAGRRVKSVTVTGYPAKYLNFRPVDEETIKAGIANGSRIGMH